ncbi:MAG TPA: tRNA epoxyqueuosine(34) reductase QueG [Myxococcales bacterium]|nr:tRNA epoxyqueuosine(34) reductase QueG [Myxococcales bacterium]
MGAAEGLTLPSSELRALAAEAGFDLCGFARADPIPGEALVSWLEAGMDADMDWMRERVAERLDVRRLLAGARTVVSFACNYFHPDPREAAGPPPVARYARGRDYHYTMQDRLRAFRRGLLARWPEVESFATVDTGPMMEKVWAARAGVGTVAKNGCLVTERFGSYVVLATMALDAAVDEYADAPAADRCGSCTLCIAACPTSAIVADRRVDARLCLSYQTIENRAGPVPEPLRPAMRDLAFGCDICQDCCPLNAAPLPGGDRFLPRAVAQLSARDLAALTPEAYAQLVPGTALARAKYDGLRRNAAYALGAARDAGSRNVLERLAADPSPMVVDAARWALQRLGLTA